MRTATPSESDPFGERSPTLGRKPLLILGARIHFDSNSRELLRLVDVAYTGLPHHRSTTAAPDLRITLLLRRPRPTGRLEPAGLQLLHGGEWLGASTDGSNFVVLSPGERTALVVVSPEMLRFPYNIRYELIEFAVFTLAARVQRLVSLHGACVGAGGRGVLLMGPSGAGKSTVALQCLLQGLDFLAEDSVFVAPDTMRATGVANFLHVRADSLRWLARARDVAAIRSSPVIRRRSGIKKFEIDLRLGGRRLAASPLKIVAIVFLSKEPAAQRPLLRPLTRAHVVARSKLEQAYAANQPQWSTFRKSLSGIAGFELRRGRHPREAVDVLRQLVDGG